jgi:hypothetical protein
MGKIATPFTMVMTYARDALHDILRAKSLMACMFGVLRELEGFTKCLKFSELHIRIKCMQVTIAIKCTKEYWAICEQLNKILEPVKNTFVSHHVFPIEVYMCNCKSCKGYMKWK